VLGAVELSKDITTIQDISDDPSRFFMQNKSVSDKNECSIAKYSFSDIITRNTKMLENINKSKMIASTPSSVLIYGATGTGKELFVQSIHNYGLRRNKPFIAQNCAALPETLFESILFGTVKGAFTGASDKPGLFELANGGTLFLDEINSMSLSLQSKLLRVIQDGVVRKIGGIRDIKVDVRIIAAMNVDPAYAISSKQLREDLFYRLNVMSIKLVPLCQRKEDIPLLTEYFIKKYNSLLNKNVEGVTKDVAILFSMHNWPGNVRELQHVIEASMNIVSSGKIDVRHLPIYLDEMVNDDNRFCEIDDIKPLNDVIEMVERNLIKKALERSGGNITKASKLLKIPRQTLQYKIYKYGLEVMEIVDIG
jgi:arginine utilization regulatory protein